MLLLRVARVPVINHQMMNDSLGQPTTVERPPQKKNGVADSRVGLRQATYVAIDFPSGSKYVEKPALTPAGFLRNTLL